jgi:ribosomal protein L25 (general stress protein Ctc)
MKKGKLKVFKIRNRKGYAAICAGHLTEGRSVELARQRMLKALRRTSKKKK